jgi:hypothetical protein
MLRDDAVAIAQMLMGFRTDQAANIVTMFQFVQTQFEMGPIRPWFLLQEDSLVRTTVGDERIEIPQDFIAECDELPLRYRPDDYPTEDEVQLRKDAYDVLKKNFAPSTILQNAQQIPQAYARVGNYFRIFPLPDANYMIRLIYYARDTVLSSNVENKWLKYSPDLFVGKAGKLLATGLRDAGAYGEFTKMEATGYDRLMRENEEQKHVNQTYQMGGPVWAQARAGMLPPGVSPAEIDDGT